MKIGLKEAVVALRQELSESILAGANEKLQFEIGEILLQFQVEIEQSVDAWGKINIWVVEMGGGGSRATTSTHTVSIPLKPVYLDQQGPVRTSSNIIPD